MRTIDELRDVDDPAWPAIEAAIASADQPAEVIPGNRAAGEQSLLLLKDVPDGGQFYVHVVD